MKPFVMTVEMVLWVSAVSEVLNRYPPAMPWMSGETFIQLCNSLKLSGCNPDEAADIFIGLNTDVEQALADRLRSLMTKLPIS